MTDPMELVKRLEAKADKLGCDEWRAPALLKEAAVCIREMVGEKQSMQARLDRWEQRPGATPMLPVGERNRCNKILLALGQAYPRTCFVCRLGPCRDEIVPHAFPSVPAAKPEKPC